MVCQDRQRVPIIVGCACVALLPALPSKLLGSLMGTTLRRPKIPWPKPFCAAHLPFFFDSSCLSMILAFGWPQGPKNSSVWLDLSQNLFAQMKGGKSSLPKSWSPIAWMCLVERLRKTMVSLTAEKRLMKTWKSKTQWSPCQSPLLHNLEQLQNQNREHPQRANPQSWRQWPVRSTQRNSSKPRKNQ